ncbi:MAG: UDP-2,3-diacylglucosamine diphosphatase [Proteobacteria bacterium]|nr:UDP-2,3-diacylglucosamine diphosphatase [Pseudomonadota bacterium]
MQSDELEESGKKHYRAVFLSDIHLGARGCQAERLVAFLKAHTCDQLYLVGDIIDGWRLRSSFYWPQSHNNAVRRILTLVKRGTRLTYVTGNHDEFLRRYSELVLGNISLVDRAVHETADGRRLLVVHGDQFDVVTRYHRWIAFLGDIGYNLLLRLNRYLNWLRRKFGYGYWSLSAWIKHRVKQAVNYASDYERAVSHECRRRGFDGVICGHIHRAEIRDIDGIRYMNCGDWVESCTALVEDQNGVFRLIDRSRNNPVVHVAPVANLRRAG